MADQHNVSAFAAYSSFIEAVASPKKPVVVQLKKPKPSAAAAAAAAAANNKNAAKPKAADKSFTALSHDEMIARLISNKKQELKRKSDSVPLIPPTPAKKPNKRAKAKQAAAAKQSAEAAAPAEEAGKPAKAQKPKKLNPIKIHLKDPSEFAAKRTNKRNAKPANQKQNGQKPEAKVSSPVATAEEPASADVSDTEFVDLVQSTPFVGAPPATNGVQENGGGNDSRNSAKRKRQQTLDGTPSKNVQQNDLALVKVEPHTPKPTKRSAAAAIDDSLGSIEAAKNLLAWIVHPTPVEQFLGEAWEKTPLLIDRKCPGYYSQLLSTEIFDRMLREQRVEFTKNLDVTSYVDGVRKTHNPEGRAMSPTVWDFYAQGCSVRLLNPQTFLPVVHSLNATLQEYFQCMTGANVYLTPANSQGFAPHYDDIEAFVLQIEGRKHWKVYKPRSAAETLPRDSSPNFTQAELGPPILDVILEAGDLLYFPRGFIHQATTVPGHHSMHMTLSAYQKTAYADLLENLLPQMLQSTIADSVLLRRGLPPAIWQCMGLVHSDADEAEAEAAAARRAVLQQIRACLELTMKSLEEHVDDAVDRLAVRFQHDALPPHLTAAERERSVYGTAARPGFDGVGGAVGLPLPGLETPLRLVRANVLRLVRHSAEEFRVYYSTDNSREYHELEPAYVEISAEDAPAVEYLVKTYPAYTRPKEWPIEEAEQAVGVAQDLWERGLLLAKERLVLEDEE